MKGKVISTESRALHDRHRALWEKSHTHNYCLCVYLLFKCLDVLIRLGYLLVFFLVCLAVLRSEEISSLGTLWVTFIFLFLAVKKVHRPQLYEELRSADKDE